ncbi:MAG TPA: BatD family protein, partial [Cellvibrio sp.]
MKLTDSTIKLWLSRCIGFLLMVTGLNVFAGNLTASVDRDTLGLEETFTLVLRYDEQINASPDYELLQKDFDILNTQSGTQMSIVNGSMEASTEWKIALAPKRIGKLLIPSFNIDGAVSDAIEITVEGKSRKPKDSDNNVSVEIETSVDAAYVQQQIIVTLRLYTTVGLSGIELQPMQVKDALVVQLDEKQYQTKINNRPGAVVETRYAIFPQQSGELIIPSMLYQVSVNQGGRDIWDRFYGNNRNNILRLRTDEQRINVLPAPASAAGNNWMPAKSLELSEHWSTDISALKVGEPVTRTITIKADGLTAGQITPLDVSNIDGVTFYKDQAQTDDQKSPDGVVGTRTETIAIVPTKEGTFTLPQTEVRWWNNHSQMMETAYLNAVTLKVGSGVASQPATTGSNTIASVDENTSEEPVDTSAVTGANTNQLQIQQVEKTPVWLYVTNLVSLLIAAFFAFKFLQQRRATESNRNAHNHVLRAQQETETQAWGEVKRQLADKSLTGLRKAIIDWGRIYWRAPDLNGLNSVAERARDIELGDELRKLDEAIFSNQNAVPDLDKLLQILANLRRDKQKNNNADLTLKPLYPN